ncbi:MAG TPA: hypothetical protein PKU80_13640 [Candidatus Limiplasma sp.]|nr:hypothetical protein [Candidatus Limiplasma sp.]HRX07784.1 hypothetical protein [Candidatus Limiplasma sp.]
MTDAVLDALREIRLPYALYEMDIHRHVMEALQTSGIPFLHEAKLSKGCRIDYLAGSVGIEIKKGKPNEKRLMAQLMRYLDSDALESIIVVGWHSVRIPPVINGKRAEQVALSQLWGVSLP